MIVCNYSVYGFNRKHKRYQRIVTLNNTVLILKCNTVLIFIITNIIWCTFISYGVHISVYLIYTCKNTFCIYRLMFLEIHSQI